MPITFSQEIDPEDAPQWAVFGNIMSGRIDRIDYDHLDDLLGKILLYADLRRVQDTMHYRIVEKERPHA